MSGKHLHLCCEKSPVGQVLISPFTSTKTNCWDGSSTEMQVGASLKYSLMGRAHMTSKEKAILIFIFGNVLLADFSSQHQSKKRQICCHDFFSHTQPIRLFHWITLCGLSPYLFILCLTDLETNGAGTSTRCNFVISDILRGYPSAFAWNLSVVSRACNIHMSLWNTKHFPPRLAIK